MMQKFNVSTASLINHPVAGQMVGYALAYFGFTNGLGNLSEVQIYFTEFFPENLVSIANCVRVILKNMGRQFYNLF